MLLGVDDTDSLAGGCTTHVAVRLALGLREEVGLGLLDHPRLVRLNPANPWKTRGNAALALHLGEPSGRREPIGSWAGAPVHRYPDGKDIPPTEEVLEAAWRVVSDLTWREDGRTNPGLVLAEGPLPPTRYTDALHRILDMGPVEETLADGGILHRATGTRRGLIGASAAVAWPLEPATWELLAYRPRERWGTPRGVDPGSVREMDARVTSTFDSYDAPSGGLTMVPSSPCPVLFGIRGTDPDVLETALGIVRSEPPEGWVIFRTNQATDDHLRAKPLGEVGPFEGVAVRGAVASRPATIEGGHVLFAIEEAGARLDVAAYEPTKAFRDVVRQLRPGDVVLACGSVRDRPRTLNLEKLRLLSLGSTTERVKVGNPRCPDCGKAMKSVGAGAGYRCVRCGTRARSEDAPHEDRPRAIGPGWYEVPTGARRHLARPLELGVMPHLEALRGPVGDAHGAGGA